MAGLGESKLSGRPFHFRSGFDVRLSGRSVRLVACSLVGILQTIILHLIGSDISCGVGCRGLTSPRTFSRRGRPLDIEHEVGMPATIISSVHAGWMAVHRKITASPGQRTGSKGS